MAKLIVKILRYDLRRLLFDLCKLTASCDLRRRSAAPEKQQMMSLIGCTAPLHCILRKYVPFKGLQRQLFTPLYFITTDSYYL